MATKSKTEDRSRRERLLTLLESKANHLADKSKRQHAQLLELREEREKLLQDREQLKTNIRALEQKLSVRGDTTAIAPVLELRQEVNEMIGIVDQCLDLLENGIR